MMGLLPIVAAIVLAADPAAQGLPFGVPPGPEDAVIRSIAPSQCLFYMNWAGTRAPDAASSSETEKLLAEPEVQEFLKAIGKVITVWLKKQDEEAKKPDAASAQTPPSLLFGQVVDPSSSPKATPAHYAAIGDQVDAALVKGMPTLDLSYQETGEFLSLLLTRPMAVFLADIKVATHKSAETQLDKMTDAKQPAEGESFNEDNEEKRPADNTPEMEVQGGLVISLGPDASRWKEKFHKLLQQNLKAGADSLLEQIDREGETWYRSRPTKPGDKNTVTFGFRGNYFVAAVGEGTLEGMLARWNSPPPAWLEKALAQAPVPRRIGVLYLNVKTIRDKLLPLAEKQKEAIAVLELLGLNNADSLVTTTGLDEQGMIGRTLLALDGKPRGLLDMISDRPLKAADLEPIPSNALLAFAARVDLDRSFDILLSACEKVAELESPDSAEEFRRNKNEALEKIGKEYGIDIHRFLSSVGDTWCIYNSPTEGEIAFLGWTAVVSVRDRAAMVENWEKLCALSAKSQADNEAGNKDAKKDWSDMSFDGPLEFRKCSYAGHEVYYVAGQVIAPALCISDREMVMTLNMPAMKAYLNRKNHRSLAALPGVALALKDGKGPISVWYCDTPKLFDFFYPLFSLYGTAAAGLAQRAQIDLDPTYWPSAPAIRPHLRPDITTVERTTAGLQVTSRYSLPWGGGDGLMWLMSLSALGQTFAKPSSPEMPGLQDQPSEPATGTTADPQLAEPSSPTHAPVAEPPTPPTKKKPTKPLPIPHRQWQIRRHPRRRSTSKAPRGSPFSGT